MNYLNLQVESNIKERTMTKYLDFHNKDMRLEHIYDNSQYCKQAEKIKKEEWYPFMSFPITQICNFKCFYCGEGGEATSSNVKITSFDTIKEYMEYEIKAGIKKFRITGGEPFTHPDIDEILLYMSKKGYYVLVNTNGSLLYKHKDMIGKLGSNIHFAVSYDTMKSEKMKVISKVNCHSKVQEGISLLKENGLLLRLNMVIEKYNRDEVEEIIEYCKKLKCDLKILDVVSVPVPFSDERKNFYQEVDSLEAIFKERCDAIYSHEYTRGFGTPCFRYKFGDIFVTVKNSKKGSHYDRNFKNDVNQHICDGCKYYPCHEGLYDIFVLSDGRICSCRWTEKQTFDEPILQLKYMINAFRRSKYIETGNNRDMKVRNELIK